MAKKRLALCSTFPDEILEQLSEYVDITPAGFYKSGGKPVDEETLLNECLGFEMVALAHEKTSERCIKAWKESGMKFITCCRGTPTTVDVAAVRRNGLELCYAPGRNAEAVAEYTFGMILALTRGIFASSYAIREGLYLAPPQDDLINATVNPAACWFAPDGSTFDSIFGAGPELYGRTLGIVGFGNIGARVARIAQGFGMKVLGNDTITPPERIRECGAEPAEIERVFAESDFVSIHLPLLDDTIGMIDGRLLGLMKPTAYLINTSRAHVVNLKAFLETMDAGKIAGAAVDVYWTEPLPCNHPVLKLPNVLATPHMAGVSADVDAWTGRIAAEDIIHYCKGEPLQHIWRGN